MAFSLYQVLILGLMSVQIAVTGYLALKTYRLTKRDIESPNLEVEVVDEKPSKEPINVEEDPELVKEVETKFLIKNTGRGDALISDISFEVGSDSEASNEPKVLVEMSESYESHLSPGESTVTNRTVHNLEASEHLKMEVMEERRGKEVFGFQVNSEEPHVEESEFYTKAFRF